MEFRNKKEGIECLSSKYTDDNTLAAWTVLRYIYKSGNDEYLSMLPGIEKMLLELGDIKANVAFAKAVKGASVNDQIDIVINSECWAAYGDELLWLADLKEPGTDVNKIAEVQINNQAYVDLLDLVGHVDGVDTTKPFVFLRSCSIDVEYLEDFYFGKPVPLYLFDDCIEEDTPRIKEFINGYKAFLEFVEKYELGEIIESNKDVISEDKKTRGKKKKI